MNLTVDTPSMEAAASPGGSAPLAALQDTALKAVGIAFLLSAGNALPFEVGGIVMYCFVPSASGPAATTYMVASFFWSLGGHICLAAAGVVLLLRARSLAQRLWPGDGQDSPAPLTSADVLTHFVVLVALYLLIPALTELPGTLWQFRKPLPSGIVSMSVYSDAHELLRCLTLVCLCAFSLAKARRLGAWMARRAGLAG